MTRTTRARNGRPNILEGVSEGRNLLWPLFIAASVKREIRQRSVATVRRHIIQPLANQVQTGTVPRPQQKSISAICLMIINLQGDVQIHVGHHFLFVGSRQGRAEWEGR